MRFGFVLALLFCHLATAAETNLLRADALNRPRRIIFNNDGNEPVYFCNAATPEELLRSRTAPLLGSQVDTIFYCTWSSGFGLFTHHTKVGQLFSTREAMFAPNRTQEFFERGIDPLRVMVDFAHQHGIELFWSFRMNDTHDASTAVYGPVMFRANKLKQDHPEYLIGSITNRPKFGHWSAVNYALPEIRNLAFKYCEEVCQNYDVDGIELDFFRHAFFFKSSASNQPCSAAELAQMTDLMRRIRAMTEAVARKRHRPLLIAMRVPDSAEYCKFIGLDLERWLRDGLLDLMIAGGYVQMNPWQTSVALGHKYGVKVYPSLDEPRVRDESSRQLRNTIAAYRARAATAWSAGVDGIYVFNHFNPLSEVWRELGDPQHLQHADKDYFVSYLGRGSVDVPHDKFQTLPTLNPANPLQLRTNHPIQLPLLTAEAHDNKNTSRKVTLRLKLKEATPIEALRISLNNVALKYSNTESNWLQFPVDASTLRSTNQIDIITTGVPATLTDAFLSLHNSE